MLSAFFLGETLKQAQTMAWLEYGADPGDEHLELI